MNVDGLSNRGRRDGPRSRSTTAVRVAAALLVLLMFSSYALRSWSPRVASLGADGRHHRLYHRRRLHRRLRLVSGIVDALNTARGGTPSERAGKALRRHLDRARKCRSAIETQFPGAVVRTPVKTMSTSCACRCSRPKKDWRTSPIMPKFRAGCGRCLTRSSGRSRAPCTALAAALRGDVDEESRDAVARRARVLRGHIIQALTQTTKTGEAPFSAGGACSRSSRCSDVARSSPNPSRRQGSWPPLHPTSSVPRNHRVTTPLLRLTEPALVVEGHPVTSARSPAGTPQTCPRLLRRG